MEAILIEGLKAAVPYIVGALVPAVIAGIKFVIEKYKLRNVLGHLNTIYDVVDPLLAVYVEKWDKAHVRLGVGKVIDALADGEVSKGELEYAIDYVLKKYLADEAAEKTDPAVLPEAEKALLDKVVAEVEAA